MNQVFLKKYMNRKQQDEIMTHLYTEYSVQDQKEKSPVESVIKAYDRLLSDFRASNKSKYLIFFSLNDSKG